MTIAPVSASQATLATSNRAVGLVCIAHFLSHFYLMLLPPLFPVLSQAMNIGYTEVGIALTAFSLVSGFTQAPMGFLVDRFGPHAILVAGILVESIAFGMIGITPVYGVFLALLGIAGVANSVYHPANYVILNSIVQDSRIGRAFSYHTAAGLLGEAVAPAFILLLAALVNWPSALLICGSMGILTAFGLLMNTRSLTISSTELGATSAEEKRGINILFSAPILMGVVFFVGISVVNRGITGFSVSALHEGHGLSLGVAGTLLSAWLFASPFGVLLGGRIADRSKHHARNIAVWFTVIAGCIVGIVVFSPSMWICGPLFALSGFFAGMVSPSRDMLIRSVTPAGQYGKVFGFVSTGFNIGGILAPPIYGYILDNSDPDLVFWIAALASVLTIFTVLGAKPIRQNG